MVKYRFIKTEKKHNMLYFKKKNEFRFKNFYLMDTFKKYKLLKLIVQFLKKH